MASLALNSIVWPFMALDLNASYTAIMSTYGIPYIVLAIVWVVSSFGAAAAKKAAKKAAKDKKTQ